MPKTKSESHVAAAIRRELRGPAAAPLPPVLAAIAAGRDHLLTEEFAMATGRANQTIRKNYCMKGECFGIRPLKFGNRLLWPVHQIAALLNGDAPEQDAFASDLVKRRKPLMPMRAAGAESNIGIHSITNHAEDTCTGDRKK
jgi:hypothetical protein